MGAEIEELDIRDLRRAMAESMHADVTRVYQRLLEGSIRHLLVFTDLLEGLGERYRPRHLDQTSYDALRDTRALRMGPPPRLGRGGRPP